MPKLKWSKLKNYPNNGSKNLYHNSRMGRIIVHLLRGQRLENYWRVHGKFPAPGVKPVKLFVPPANVKTRTPKEKFAFVRRAFNDIHKPWAVSKATINKINNTPGGNMGVTVIIRDEDKELFYKAMRSLKYDDIGLTPNGNGRWYANLTYGFNVKFKLTKSENFRKKIEIVNRTTPVYN